MRLEKSKGRTERRVPNAPAAWYAKKNKHTSIVTTNTPVHPAFRTQWFTAYSVLSPVIGLSCHRRLQNSQT
jgi:hypothetical protein